MGNFDACDYRAYGGFDTGSSKNYSAFADDFGGILLADPEKNPGFYADHHVFVKYCDGTSFTSERSAPVKVRGKPVYMRGRANLRATLHTLLRGDHLGQGYGSNNISLRQATEVILTGGSAGGFATYQALDYVE